MPPVLLVVADWGYSGRIIEIALYTDTEYVYEVEHNSLTRELMNQVYRRVEIRGKICKHPGRRKLICAEAYVLLKEILDNL